MVDLFSGSSANVIAVLLGLLPSFAWLIFYLKEDSHPEPKRLIALTFLAGGLFAFFAFFAQLFLVRLLCGTSGLESSRPFECLSAADGRLPFFLTFPIFLAAFALLEEVVKFAAAYFSVHRSKAFNEPVDAMVYMVVAALGFAAVENLGIVNFGALPAGTPWSETFQTISMRFIGATLLHALSSAIVGYYWAASIRDFGLKRPLLWGLFLATALHAMFNYLILTYETATYTVVLLVVIGFFVLNDFEKLNRRAV
ncbi:MAG: PrsW family glutamic-type intramembrane protease [Patescibacteria group bacterium]